MSLPARANTFTTLQLDCDAEYDTGQLRPAHGENAIAIVGDGSQDRIHHTWKVWWRRPDCWRDDITWDTGDSAVSIVCGATSVSYLSALDTRRGARQPHLFMRRLRAVLGRHALRHEPTLQQRLEQMPLAQARGLTQGWSLTTLGEREHAGRRTLRVRAVRGTGAMRFGLWDYVNEYIVDVDEERGVLLRCAAIVDGKEAAVLGARSVTFDEPIPDAVFTDRHAAG